MFKQELGLTATLVVVLIGLLASACGSNTAPTQKLASTLAPTPPPTGIQTRIIAVAGDLNCGTLLVGSTAVRTLTISNSGNALLTWTGLSTGTTAVTASATSGTIDVTVGGTQNTSTVTLTFVPTAALAYSGTITVTGDQTSGANTIGFSGIGSVTAVPVGIIGLAGDLAFGGVAIGSTATKVLTVTNRGNAALTVSRVETMSAVTVNLPYPTVAPGASATLTFNFTPTAATSYSGTLTVSSSASNFATTLPMSGTGTPG